MNLLLCLTLALGLAAQTLCYDKIVDWSSASVLPNQKWYNIDGKETPLERIFAENGFNTVRQRHFVGENIAYDHKSNIELAKRARSAGLQVYIDLHFREGWNDPQTIQCHKSWGNTVESLSKGIYNYCLGVGNSFAQENIIPKYISLGNEITHGICDLGNMSHPDGAKNTATFLSQAARGIRDSKLGRKPQLVLHLENGWNTTVYEWFLGAVGQAGHLDYDAVGMTTYAFYTPLHATQANFLATIKMIQLKFRKQVLLVETAWPRQIWGNKQPDLPPDTKHIPVSIEGQIEWIKLLGKTARTGKALGCSYFEPAWLNNTHTGSNFKNTLLFDDRGRALPSLAVFKDL